MEAKLRIDKSEVAAAQLTKEIQQVETKLALFKSEYENKKKDLYKLYEAKLEIDSTCD